MVSHGDLLIKISFEGSPFHQIGDKSFLEQYNWSQFAKKSYINLEKLSNFKRSPKKVEREFVSDQQNFNQECNEQKYLLIQQNKFMVCLKKYENNRELIYNNIIKCIPQTKRITSKRVQDNIVKSIESINLFEGTVINQQQDQFITPRKQQLQKFKKDSLWFLVAGNGVIEQKLNEITTISLSVISDGSLFGEEILFQDLQMGQEENEQNLLNLKFYKENIESNLGKFQLRTTSKLSKMYFIQKELFLQVFPSEIVQEIRNNYIQKVNSRQELLKQQTQCQIQQNYQPNKQIFEKPDFRRQKSEIICNNVVNKSEQRNSLAIIPNNEDDIHMQKLLEKKQTILNFQENLLSKKVFFIDSPVSSNRDVQYKINSNQKIERRSSQEIQKKPSIQLNLKSRNSICLKETKDTNQSSLNEHEKIFSYEGEQNSSSSHRTTTPQTQQVSQEKKHLQKQIFNIINKGFDFGTKDKRHEYKKEQAIKMLQLKNGIINTSTKVRHPSIYENQEKLILKQQQKIQSVSIARMFDNPSNQQSILNIYTNSDNKQINALNQSKLERKQQSFYLTPKESLNCQSARQLKYKLQSSFKNASFKTLRYNSTDNDKIATSTDVTPSQCKTNTKSFTSLKRPSDQTYATKLDEFSLIQLGLSLVQIPQNELSERKRSSLINNKTLNLSNISDNNKQKGIIEQRQENNNFDSDDIGSRQEDSQNKENSFIDLISKQYSKTKKARNFSSIIQSNNEEERNKNQINTNQAGLKQIFTQRTYNSFNDLLDFSQIVAKNNVLSSQIISQDNQPSRQIQSQNILKRNNKSAVQREINTKSQEMTLNQVNISSQQTARQTTKISQLLQEYEKAKSEKKQINFHSNQNNIFSNKKINEVISQLPSFDSDNFKQIQDEKFSIHQLKEQQSQQNLKVQESEQNQHQNVFRQNINQLREQHSQQSLKVQEIQQLQNQNIFKYSIANTSPRIVLENSNLENSLNINGQKIPMQKKIVQLKQNKGEYTHFNKCVANLDDQIIPSKLKNDQMIIIQSNIQPRERKLSGQYTSRNSERKSSQILQGKENVQQISSSSSQQFYRSAKNDASNASDISSLFTFQKGNSQLKRCNTIDRYLENTTDQNSKIFNGLSQELNSQQNILISNKQIISKNDDGLEIFEDDTFGIQNKKKINLQVKAELQNNQTKFPSTNNLDALMKQNQLNIQDKQQQQQQNSYHSNQKFDFKSFLFQKSRNNKSIKRKNISVQKDIQTPNLLLYNQKIQKVENNFKQNEQEKYNQ